MLQQKQLFWTNKTKHISLSLSLSLSIYIYIYTYKYYCMGPKRAQRGPDGPCGDHGPIWDPPWWGSMGGAMRPPRAPPYRGRNGESHGPPMAPVQVLWCTIFVRFQTYEFQKHNVSAISAMKSCRYIHGSQLEPKLFSNLVPLKLPYIASVEQTPRRTESIWTPVGHISYMITHFGDSCLLPTDAVF
jgi:hypothetical protein